MSSSIQSVPSWAGLLPITASGLLSLMNKPFDLAQTKALAQSFAQRFKESRLPKVLALTGELGSGKTTFVQFLAQALGIEKRILSPTFVITRSYPFFVNNQRFTLYHVDLFRLSGDDLGQIGLEDLINEPNSLVAIEWAEKASVILPPKAKWISFKIVASDKRRFLVK